MAGYSTYREVSYQAAGSPVVQCSGPARLPIAENSRELPAITSASALFLDFDGTLADLVLAPEDACLPPGLRVALAARQRSLTGALAIVTGREIAELDRMCAPLRFTAAGIHGAEMRLGHDEITTPVSVPKATAETLAGIAVALAEMLAPYAGLHIERKSLGLALHYRAAPGLAAMCLRAAVAAVGHTDGFDVRLGKLVVEILPVSANKGTAIRHFMRMPPFAGRVPLFAGDDVADEAAIEAVQSMGGIGIRIVDDPMTQTCAAVRVGSARIVREWLITAA